jgi:hypothetical protein
MFKTKALPAICHLMLRFLKLPNFDAVCLLDIVIQGEGLHVYNMHNIVERQFTKHYLSEAGASR